LQHFAKIMLGFAEAALGKGILTALKNLRRIDSHPPGCALGLSKAERCSQQCKANESFRRDACA
jgi:hypothetical protein